MRGTRNSFLFRIWNIDRQSQGIRWSCSTLAKLMRPEQLSSLPKPILRWAGSKKKLLPKLREYYPDNARYIEPFAGSACLFFSLNPWRAVLGDLNQELISMYLELKYRSDAVVAGLKGLRRGREKYLQFRNQTPKVLTPTARAVRFIYLNRYCFNGIYRTNAQGRFNVPFGGKGTGRLPKPTDISNVSKALNRARLIAGDFAKTLKFVERGDFVYLDPPFATNSQRVFREYDKSIFSGVDVMRLRIWMNEVHARGAKFLVSYAECAESEWLAKGFCKEYVQVRRNIAGFSKFRESSSEILISNS